MSCYSRNKTNKKQFKTQKYVRVGLLVSLIYMEDHW